MNGRNPAMSRTSETSRDAGGCLAPPGREGEPIPIGIRNETLSRGPASGQAPIRIGHQLRGHPLREPGDWVTKR